MRVSARITLATVALALVAQASVCRSEDEIIVEDQGRRAEGFPIVVTAEVRSGTEVRVHSGTITVMVDQRIRHEGATITSAISLGYTGTHGLHCCWLQFLWREVLVTRASGTSAHAGRVITTSGVYSLTTDPNEPTYQVDSASTTSPCYDREGASNDSTGLTIFDAPGPSLPAELVTRRPGVTRVVSVAHFDSYFVCGGVVLVRVSWTATYTWTRTTGWQGPVYDVAPPDTSGARPRRPPDGDAQPTLPWAVGSAMNCSGSERRVQPTIRFVACLALVFACASSVGCRCAPENLGVQAELEGLACSIERLERTGADVELVYVLEWTSPEPSWSLDLMEPLIPSFRDEDGRKVSRQTDEDSTFITLDRRFVTLESRRTTNNVKLTVPEGARSLSLALGASGLETPWIRLP